MLCRQVEAAAKDPEAKWSSLHESAARSVLRLELAGPKTEVVVLKHYRRRSGLRGLRDALSRPFGRSPAQREWGALSAALRSGLAVPNPLAYGESACGGSFLLMQWSGEQSLVAAVDSTEGKTRVDLIKAVAALVRSVHEAGFTHGDLHVGNLRITHGSPVLLDLQKFRRRLKGLGRRKAQHADWARLAFSLERSTGAPESVNALRAESRLGAAFDEAILAHLADHQRGRSRRHLRTGQRWIPVLDRDGRTGIRDRDIPAVLFETAIDGEHGDLLDADRKQGRVQIHASSIGGRALIRKRAFAGGFRRALADRFRGSPAARAFTRSQVDRLISDRAAPALGFFERRCFGLPMESWLLLDKVGDYDLDSYVPSSREEAESIANAVVLWLAEQHARGLGHRDAKSANIRLCLTKKAHSSVIAVELWWVDLEDLTGPASLTSRQRSKALVQLNASLPDAFYDPSTRRRAFATYHERLPLNGDADRLVATLVRESIARNHRWQGDGCNIRKE